VRIATLAGGIVQPFAPPAPTVRIIGVAAEPLKTHAVAWAASGNRAPRSTRKPQEALVFTSIRFGRLPAVVPPSAATRPGAPAVMLIGRAYAPRSAASPWYSRREADGVPSELDHAPGVPLSKS